jgi:tetratricopeptide (TPR) repeat protein
MRLVKVQLALALLVFSAPVLFGAGDLERAGKLYSRTQYREAIQELAPLESSKNAPVHELIGKSYFMLAEYKKAGEAFEKAIAADPNRSEYHHWLGKAYGRRAETANPFSAPLLANKARHSFEKAVELDGKNLEAVNDLFSYYIEAPGFLGGGLDKAIELAKSKIQPNDPVEYHYAMAQIAEKRKEFRTAEFHFRQAFQMAPKSVGRAIDLARFLSKQGKVDESEAIFAQAEQVNPHSPRLKFERASSYIQQKRNLPAAKSLLEQYLNAPLSPDDPPRSEAERLLKKVKDLGA